MHDCCKQQSVVDNLVFLCLMDDDFLLRTMHFCFDFHTSRLQFVDGLRADFSIMRHHVLHVLGGPYPRHFFERLRFSVMKSLRAALCNYVFLGETNDCFVALLRAVRA